MITKDNYHIPEYDFLVICITPENPDTDEPERITRILRNNEAHIIHIRHPHISENDTKSLLIKIPEDLRDRITLHDHHTLAVQGYAGGIHLNNRNQIPPADIPAHLRVSASCHSIDDITNAIPVINSYVTLSPIFNSISKQGYKSAFSLANLKDKLPLIPIMVVALGGVTPSSFSILKETGFKGAAMLGYFLH